MPLCAYTVPEDKQAVDARMPCGALKQSRGCDASRLINTTLTMKQTSQFRIVSVVVKL